MCVKSIQHSLSWIPKTISVWSAARKLEALGSALLVGVGVPFRSDAAQLDHVGELEVAVRDRVGDAGQLVTDQT